MSIGVNFIFYYGTSYFQRSGISNPFIISVITDVVNVCSTVPGLYLVEKWGRRPLLMFGAIGMSVSQIIVASVGTAHPNDQTSNKVLIAFVCTYIFFFACSWVSNIILLDIQTSVTNSPEGSLCLGRNGRNLPTQGSRSRSQHDNGKQLVAQLGDRLRHTVHGEPGTWERKFGKQSLLHLGRLLHHLYVASLPLTSADY